MRLASLRDGTRDGALIIVGRDGDRFVRPAGASPTLQAALDDWDRAAPALAVLAAKLDAGAAGEPLDVARLRPPLPRAYEWIDGSAFTRAARACCWVRATTSPSAIRTGGSTSRARWR
jgi:fumarylacetoacetate (FAA) hydrolase